MSKSCFCSKGWWCGVSLQARPILPWRASIGFAEKLGKIAHMVKAAGEGDLCDAVGGTAQEIAADLQAVSVEKGDGRLPHIPTEDRAAFAAAHISCCGNVVQCELLRVMTINIGNHFSLGGEIAGFFSGSGGMLWGQKRKRVCKQADQQTDHFQFPAGSLFAVKRCGSFQDICTFIPVRCAGVKLPAVYRHYKKYRWVRNLTKESQGQ